MNVTVITVGKLKEKYLKLGIDEFSKRLSKYCKLRLIEVSDEKAPENLSEAEMEIVKNKEGQRILSKLNENTYMIPLCIDGKNLSSFSKMTFPHQMMKLILLEQIYRGFRISRGEPYHK